MDELERLDVQEQVLFVHAKVLFKPGPEEVVYALTVVAVYSQFKLVKTLEDAPVYVFHMFGKKEKSIVSALIACYRLLS